MLRKQKSRVKRKIACGLVLFLMTAPVVKAQGESLELQLTREAWAIDRESFEQQLQSAQGQIRDLSQRLATQEQAIKSEVASKVDSLDAQLTRVSKERNSIWLENEKLKESLTESQEALAAVQALGANRQQENAGLKKQSALVQALNARLSKLVEVSRLRLQEISELRAENEQLRQESVALRSALASAEADKNAMMAALQTRLGNLQARVDRLNQAATADANVIALDRPAVSPAAPTAVEQSKGNVVVRSPTASAISVTAPVAGSSVLPPMEFSPPSFGDWALTKALENKIVVLATLALLLSLLAGALVYLRRKQAVVDLPLPEAEPLPSPEVHAEMLVADTPKKASNDPGEALDLAVESLVTKMQASVSESDSRVIATSPNDTVSDASESKADEDAVIVPPMESELAAAETNAVDGIPGQADDESTTVDDQSEHTMEDRTATSSPVVADEQVVTDVLAVDVNEASQEQAAEVGVGDQDAEDDLGDNGHVNANQSEDTPFDSDESVGEQIGETEDMSYPDFLDESAVATVMSDEDSVVVSPDSIHDAEGELTGEDGVHSESTLMIADHAVENQYDESAEQNDEVIETETLETEEMAIAHQELDADESEISEPTEVFEEFESKPAFKSQYAETEISVALANKKGKKKSLLVFDDFPTFGGYSKRAGDVVSEIKPVNAVADEPSVVSTTGAYASPAYDDCRVSASDAYLNPKKPAMSLGDAANFGGYGLREDKRPKRSTPRRSSKRPHTGLARKARNQVLGFGSNVAPLFEERVQPQSLPDLAEPAPKLVVEPNSLIAHGGVDGNIQSPLVSIPLSLKTRTLYDVATDSRDESVVRDEVFGEIDDQSAQLSDVHVEGVEDLSRPVELSDDLMDAGLDQRDQPVDDSIPDIQFDPLDSIIAGSIDDVSEATMTDLIDNQQESLATDAGQVIQTSELYGEIVSDDEESIDRLLSMAGYNLENQSVSVVDRESEEAVSAATASEAWDQSLTEVSQFDQKDDHDFGFDLVQDESSSTPDRASVAGLPNSGSPTVSDEFGPSLHFGDAPDGETADPVVPPMEASLPENVILHPTSPGYATQESEAPAASSEALGSGSASEDPFDPFIRVLWLLETGETQEARLEIEELLSHDNADVRRMAFDFKDRIAKNEAAS